MTRGASHDEIVFLTLATISWGHVGLCAEAIKRGLERRHREVVRAESVSPPVVKRSRKIPLALAGAARRAANLPQPCVNSR
jgi:hypothetical protein